MAARSPRVLSCFSGVGGLDLAFRFVVPRARVVCYVERDLPAARVLAARMADGSLDPAPIWSDVRTVPDVVRAEWVVGGFPCQDLSAAGRRDGLGGARSGLFYALLDAADRCGARFLFLENVRGILTADGVACEVDADGVGDEPDAVRAIASVSWALADRGFDAEWVCIRASDVGAPHGRDRWFCVAWRGMADAVRGGRGEDRSRARRAEEPDDAGQRPDVADADGDGLLGLEECNLQQSAWIEGEYRPDHDRRGADLPIFPPGPGTWADAGGGRLVPLDRDAARWIAVLEARPDLAPAIEPGVRGVADWMAARVDRLRACGNGVVVVQGAVALVALLRRAGLTQ